MSKQAVRRVLVTTDTVGGVWTFSMDLAKQLAQQGIQVVLAALGGFPTPEQVSEAERVPELCLLTSNFKLEWMEDPWSDVEESGKWLMRIEEEYRPDLVHLNSFGHGNLPWCSPVVLTAHSCVLSWWKAVKKEQAPNTWNRYRDAVTCTLNSVDLVTCPTTAMGSTLFENYKFSRATVIPNGSDPSRFRPVNKEPIVLTAGRLWDEAKNVRAVARIASTLPWPVFAAGETNHPDGGEQQFRGIQLLGRLSPVTLAKWCSRAAIFASPVRYEPFGLSILEAGLSGCALVLGNIPSLHEIWGDAALYVAPDDNKALSEAIRSLISDPNLRDKMSQRSYKRALTFSSERTANLYLQAYKSVLSTRDIQCVS